MDLHLSGCVALVTGASRGIGLAVADELLAEGVRVMGTSRTAPPTRENLEHLVEDMQDPGAGARAVTACVTRLGRLDILVNNVGGARVMTGFAAESDETWSRYWELNFMSVVRTSRAALPHLTVTTHLTETRGVIVNVSSVNGSMPESSIPAYSATKAAMDNLTLAWHASTPHAECASWASPQDRSEPHCGSVPTGPPRRCRHWKAENQKRSSPRRSGRSLSVASPRPKRSLQPSSSSPARDPVRSWVRRCAWTEG